MLFFPYWANVSTDEKLVTTFVTFFSFLKQIARFRKNQDPSNF